jgi:hypothetical protein
MKTAFEFTPDSLRICLLDLWFPRVLFVIYGSQPFNLVLIEEEHPLLKTDTFLVAKKKGKWRLSLVFCQSMFALPRISMNSMPRRLSYAITDEPSN